MEGISTSSCGGVTVEGSVSWSDAPKKRILHSLYHFGKAFRATIPSKKIPNRVKSVEK